MTIYKPIIVVQRSYQSSAIIRDDLSSQIYAYSFLVDFA